MVTAVGWRLELLGRPSARPWQLLLQLGRQLMEDDYVIVASVKLILLNYDENNGLLPDVLEKRKGYHKLSL